MLICLANFFNFFLYNNFFLQHVAIRDSVLLISTLDGSLHAVGQRTGMIKWTINDVPILQMSPIANISEDSKHLLLPDPKDGTLYLFNSFKYIYIYLLCVTLYQF